MVGREEGREGVYCWGEETEHVKLFTWLVLFTAEFSVGISVTLNGLVFDNIDQACNQVGVGGYCGSLSKYCKRS